MKLRFQDSNYDSTMFSFCSLINLKELTLSLCRHSTLNHSLFYKDHEQTYSILITQFYSHTYLYSNPKAKDKLNQFTKLH